MKKMLSIVVSIVLILMMICPVVAEEAPMFAVKEVEYDGRVLCGYAIVPDDGEYYARVTFIFDESFVAVTIPIREHGEFFLLIGVPCDVYCVRIIDQYTVDPPFTVYAWTNWVAPAYD